MQMNKLMAAILFLITAMLGGCGLFGPKYVKPVVDTPTHWNSESHLAEDSVIMQESGIGTSRNSEQQESAITYTAWWKSFNDATLDTIIDQVLANNNNIQVAIGNMLSANADLEKTKMLWIPTLSVGGGGFIGQSFNQSVTSNNPAFTSFGQSSSDFYGDFAGLVPSYSVNILQLLKGQDLAKLNVKMQRAAKDAVRLAVIGQAAGSYFAILGLQRQLVLQQQMIADAESLSKYTALQVKSGAVSQDRVDAIQQVLAELQASVPTIQDNLVATNNALQVLMNKNPGTIISHNTIENIKTHGVIPVSIPSQVLKNRPDIRVAEDQVEASNLKIGLSMAQFFPSINLISPVGMASGQLNGLFNGGADFWMTQVTAAMPILNLEIYADIDKSKASYYSAYYNYIQTVRRAFADVDNGLSRYHSAVQIYNARQDKLSASNDLYKISDMSYHYGRKSYSDTIGYKLNVDSALLDVNQARMNQLNAIVHLYQVLGGGYNYKNTDKAKKFHDAHDV